MSVSQPIAPPSPLLLALEGRAWLEFVSVVPALPALVRAPQGDGHPVLVLPGWLASDRSTWLLRRFLRERGYWSHGWRLGQNRGPNEATVRGLAERLQAVHERHGQRVSLIGWSLGGIYARELARHLPLHVRQVITLASPFRDPSATAVARLARLGLVPPPEGGDGGTRRAHLAAPLAVPSTSIYSRTDGIVAWQSCLQEAGPLSENVEVRSSHCGMGHHPAALLVIADRLAQPDGAWCPLGPANAARWPWFTATTGRL